MTLSTTSRLILLIVLGLTGTATAGTVYKWVDADGTVHYGERPPASERAREIQVPDQPRGGNAPPASTYPDTQKLLDTFEKERHERAEKAAEAEKARKIREVNCSRARRRMVSYEIGGRIYEVDEQGERHYLGDAEIAQRLAAAKKEVAKWCD